MSIGGLEFFFLDLKHAGDVGRGKDIAGQSLDPGSKEPVVMNWTGGSVARRSGSESQMITGATSDEAYPCAMILLRSRP